MKKTPTNYPLDTYECPWCHHKYSSLESLIHHFEQAKHPTKWKVYLHERFRIDLSRRKKIKNGMTNLIDSKNLSTYKSPSVYAKSTAFESKRR